MPPTRKRVYPNLGDDEGEIKVIPIKKRRGDCCDEEELKTIRIVRDRSSDAVRDPVLCDICSVSLKSQAALDRHIKLLHSLDSLKCMECLLGKKRHGEVEEA